jgi:small subunit ribosomal protein S21
MALKADDQKLKASNPSYSTKCVETGETRMTQVVLRENEGIESALRRFKRQVSRAGIFQDMRKNRHFETPLEKEKRKALAKHRQRKYSSYHR